MKRQSATFLLTDIDIFKKQMLNWSNRFNICSFLDNHHYSSAQPTVECLVAVGATEICQTADTGLQSLRNFAAEHNDWIFGHFNYDCKNQFTGAGSVHPDHIGFPDLFFFVPETVLQLSDNRVTIASLKNTPETIYKDILSCADKVTGETTRSPIKISSRFSKEAYTDSIEKIRRHILRGDCYELNFCQEFFAENTLIDPLFIYQQLTAISPNPFSCFYKLDNRYVLCASPERYLQKKGTRILSQPIKGTFKRDLTDTHADNQLKTALAESEKDKSENVMVVDLVRNDLSRVCREGTVQVDELFGIYTFPQVHQMISTISGELRSDVDLVDIIAASFPMGSMTGAPKQRVMELIEQYERTKRGIYSGAVGYIDPEKDFDFNVVIRSIFYNANEQYLSYLVGGAITFYSDAEKEYEECLLKAAAINQVLAS